ncbi:MAG: NTP transferase domain-containing protein, partial [Planctomycetes bacterium]|nr:NTP transferase domain-containing protein [Planctomycetota bacterium]
MAHSQHDTLFVILARGGSKRFPGKNLAPVGGASLVARAIRCAQSASHRLSNPCRIVVSTDDDAIAEEAHRCGAEVPFVRPADVANDNATSVNAIRHAVDWFGERSVTFSEVVLLQPTSPLRSLDDVVQTIRSFRQFPNRSHVTVALRPASSGRAGYRLGADGLLHTRDVNAAGSTDHSIVKPNGAVYVCSPSWLASHDSLCVSGQTHGLTMPASRSVDVDREEDLASAQRVFDQRLPWLRDPCFVIAEAGVNHNGCMDTARRLIEAAANAGADAVKFQTFSADRLATQQAPKAAYQERHQPGGESQFEMLRRLELSPDQHRALIDDCRDHDIAFLSSA